MYKVPKTPLPPRTTSFKIIVSFRDRGEEKLAVVQNTPRQQFEIDDTPEPTPDYDQVLPSKTILLTTLDNGYVQSNFKRVRSWKKKALNHNSTIKALVSRWILL